MVQQLSKSEITYPDSDGQPMADNTEQFKWIVTIKENLEAIFADDPSVFVAGDLLWYPIEGDNKTRRAPDAMVAFGRPKGYRGSYKQWEEDNIAPQVVFEVLSPGNRQKEMAEKFQFYQRYGVQEYYVYDPDTVEFTGWQRVDSYLEVIQGIQDWTSPLLKVRFVIKPNELEIYRPDGEPFLTFTENVKRHDQARLERDEAQIERDEAKSERDEAIAKAERLAAQLKALGIDPSAD
ncbi:Uma2 family endonuclease [cf. Phormidesmis sp. LEGE 11477]|uniref:Uma2 family endonuclease n=1 Tax=cf. Phormidesmis sp. LEGE 11477 TaxID=1828680 RepID=UPI00187E0868|nr:Uma2 family endonuclease [cf. Phormidesmis sp. LEGE 11477]MBE9061627.1 Uma2 family endonuclease [cf. Phormidesmis sp. LEGE 11477]